MTAGEKRAVLAEELDRYRRWPYDRLAAAVDRTCRDHSHLSSREGFAADRTKWITHISVFWDSRPREDVRVIGDFTAPPNRPVAPFIPIYLPDVIDSFIMAPDGSFVGE